MISSGQRPTFWNRLTRFGYDALENRGRRRSAPTKKRSHEDKALDAKRRARLAETAQDAHVNFALASWAVRKHLDYVTRFRFQAKTGDAKLDLAIEELVEERSKRQNCDLARRHPLRRMLRIAEARRQLDGDVGLLKVLASPFSDIRGALQGIEADRIANPTTGAPQGFDETKWVNGVKSAAGGAAREYCICKRGQSGMEFERIVRADSLCLHASYEGTHRFDQVRGVSAMVSNLNAMRDIYEGFDYALAKVKLSQIMGFKVTRQQETDSLLTQTAAGSTDAEEEDETIAASDRYEITPGRAPWYLELDPGDDVDMVESKTPSTETVAFLKFIVQVALKSLNIPYSFFDESHTNFYGSRGGLIQYLKSCKTAHEDNQDLLDEITTWWLSLDVMDGRLALPSGVDFSDLWWEWVPDGVPWWDPVKEVNGAKASVAAGFDSPQKICRQLGSDLWENIDQIAEAKKYAEERGVTLDWGNVEPVTQPAEEEDDEDDEA